MNSWRVPASMSIEGSSAPSSAHESFAFPWVRVVGAARDQQDRSQLTDRMIDQVYAAEQLGTDVVIAASALSSQAA